MFTALFLVLSAGGLGCKAGYAGGGHSHGGGQAHGDGEEEHGHEEDETAHEVVVYESGLELFLEYPHLVAGEEARFSVHVSSADGVEPVEAGSVTVVLTSDSAPGERFEVGEPVRGGLYRPAVHPEHAETRQMFVVYRSHDRTVRFPVGEVEVHDAAPGEAHHAEESHAHGDEGGISFSKEQQWRVDFATERADVRQLQSSIPAQGIVRSAPGANARVRAPFPGRVRPPGGGFPELGDQVESGEPVAVLSPAGDSDAKPALRADLSKAKTRVQRLERRVERLEPLVEEGVVPAKRLRVARSEKEAAAADVEAARRLFEQYESFENGGRETAVTLRAPSDGRLYERHVAGGEFVEGGEVVARTSDERELRLEVRIAAANAGRVDEIDSAWFRPEVGEPVELNRSKDRLFARLRRVDRETRTSSTWFELPEHEGLAEGQYHRVRVRTGQPRGVVAVPESALLERKGIWMVFVATGPESFERRRVEVGMRDGEYAEITDGVEEGERIVARGAYYVELASATTGVGGHHH